MDHGHGMSVPEALILETFCQHLVPSDTAHSVVWRHRSTEDGLVQATVEIDMFGVPHTFPSVPKDNGEVATKDAARRALWYLQCPGFEDIFEPDPDFVKAAAQTIPDVPSAWTRDETEEDGEQQL